MSVENGKRVKVRVGNAEVMAGLTYHRGILTLAYPGQPGDLGDQVTIENAVYRVGPERKSLTVARMVIAELNQVG